MEMEGVTHALRWIASRCDSQTTHAIILTDSMILLQKVKSGMESPDIGMCQCSTSIFEESYGYTAMDMPESKEMTEQIDWRAKQPFRGGLRLGSYEVLRSLRH